MFFRRKTKSFTKSKNFNNIFLSILFIFSFLLIIFNKTDYLVVNKIKSFSVDIITPVTKVISSPVVISNNIIKKVNNLKYLENENRKLKEEVIRLKKWQTLAIKNQRENEAYRKLLNSTTNNTKLIKTASVISKSPNLYAKNIVINAGRNDGLKEDLVVINERGLVGKIISLSKHHSKIILINDQNSSIPVKTINGNFHAILKGTANGKFLTNSFIKDEKQPKKGDILVTSSINKIFPQDILVGKIISVKNNSFIAIPFIDLENLNFVQVIDLD